jgi:hypothetical protein
MKAAMNPPKMAKNLLVINRSVIYFLIIANFLISVESFGLKGSLPEGPGPCLFV